MQLYFNSRIFSFTFKFEIIKNTSADKMHRPARRADQAGQIAAQIVSSLDANEGEQTVGTEMPLPPRCCSLSVPRWESNV
jgi:hypothetical protein